MGRDRRARAAFTLVEVLVALVIGALVVLGARVLLEGLSEGATRTIAAAARVDREANGEMLLRDLAGRLEVGTSDSARFAGGPTWTTFDSWCDTPGGWQERCRVTLLVHVDPSGSSLVALAAGDSVALLHRDALLELRYLDDPRAGGRWFVSWGEGITAPLALGVVAGDDTLIVRIGGRG